ncbi:FRG domain-containing protein [Bradyrhizobium sp. NDS-1]|uniref:FRG domain-containing protein n=1 Tax=Bradyrhizobium sp. NDS-1 TaxID=3080014 RepID=UPI00293E39C5|nr:FRG domain-containing protein [Bradyrhizobium sp. NDS-1]WOH76455.1 FRG domain-containing protein [Bradyrhizobium sp. NDS-1]
METIGSQTIWGLYDRSSVPEAVSNTVVRRGPGHSVKSYVDLAQKIAALQFLNREHVLLFRGQSNDYLTRSGLTTIKPTIFRSSRTGKIPSQQTLANRFTVLRDAEKKLISRYEGAEFVGADRLARHRLLRWSILQHYEVCPTPLLDVSHSLRVAASFATSDESDEAFVYVLAVPNLSGAITASSEASMQIVRLSSACPPSAMRPHLQEGYLLGEYPEIADITPLGGYLHSEMDFGRRLVAKFRFNPETFWKSDTFPKLAIKALYPTGNRDPVEQTMLELKAEIEEEMS